MNTGQGIKEESRKASFDTCQVDEAKMPF